MNEQVAHTAPARPLLASASEARFALLSGAGVEADRQAADLDETAIISSLTSSSDPMGADDIALVLAGAKAESVSREHPGRLGDELGREGSRP